MPATTRTVPRWGAARNGAGYPRPREVSIGEQVRRALGLRSVKAAEKRIEAFRAFLVEMSKLAGESPTARQWLARWIEPAVAATTQPDVEDPFDDHLRVLARVDATEDHARTVYLTSARTPADLSRYVDALRRQQMRSAEALAAAQLLGAL